MNIPYFCCGNSHQGIWIDRWPRGKLARRVSTSACFSWRTPSRTWRARRIAGAVLHFRSWTQTNVCLLLLNFRVLLPALCLREEESSFDLRWNGWVFGSDFCNEWRSVCRDSCAPVFAGPFVAHDGRHSWKHKNDTPHLLHFLLKVPGSYIEWSGVRCHLFL